MKKIIISTLLFAFSILGVNSAYATDRFNTDPQDLPTVMVCNITQQGECPAGPGMGNWQTSITAQPGDRIAVQVYFHNATAVLAEDSTVSIKPQTTSSGTTLTFTGGVASTTIDRATGSATVRVSSSQSASFIPGTVRVFRNGQTTGYTVSNETSLFGSSGLMIGDVSPGWSTQGAVVAQYRLSGTTTGPTDDNNCQIDSFTADDYSIDEGDDTELNWRTTDCDYVTISAISNSHLNADDSETVSPDDTETYTLRAYDFDGNLSDSETLTIDVDTNNQTCEIDSFTASPSSIDRGDDSTLRWNTSGDVDRVTISGLSGDRNDDGSVSVSPFSTTTYTLRAYCADGDSETDTVTVRVNNAADSAPQAITTSATILGTTQARLGGIAVPNTTDETTRAWFEWGSTGSLGNRTTSQIINLNNSSQYYSDLVSGLRAGTTYFYRAVVENDNGTSYGDIVSFRTTSISTTTPPPRVVNTQTVVVAQSAPSLLELRVDSNYDRMCIGGTIDYTITYRNISSQTLEKTVLRFTHPKELTYISSSRGEYEIVDRTMTIDLGTVAPGETGTITVHARVNETAVRGNLTVTTVSVVYTNSKTHAQEDATAYSLITVSNDCPNILGASAFGFGAFLPTTLLGWLLLILIILALIVLSRQLYKKKAI